MNEWYKDFFQGMTLEFWKGVVPPRYTEVETYFLIEELMVREGGYVLDVPCGYGRNALELARHGLKVTALDFSEEYIKELAKTSREANLPITPVIGDMLEFSLDGPFDAAVCLGNSYSYFDYEGMVKFTSNVGRHLEEEGRFIIHTGMLAESILPNLLEREWMVAGDITFLIENSYRLNPSRIETNYVFIKDGTREMKSAVHFIYTLSEVERMLKESGFVIRDVYGSIEDRPPYRFKDPQAYIVAEKFGGGGDEDEDKAEDQ